MVAVTGKGMFGARKKKYVRQNINLTNTMRLTWRDLDETEKRLYREAANRSRYFRSTKEGLAIFDRPTGYGSYVLNSTNQLQTGMHLSLPVQSVCRWLPRIPYARHHFIVSKVNRSQGKIEVVELSGASTSSAKIQKRIVFLKTRLQAGEVMRHTYGNLKVYPAKEVTERGNQWLGKPGVFGNSFGFRTNNCEVAATFFMVGLGFSQQTGVYHIPK